MAIVQSCSLEWCLRSEWMAGMQARPIDPEKASGAGVRHLAVDRWIGFRWRKYSRSDCFEQLAQPMHVQLFYMTK
jgi:hypothetical protein